jgi:hypothetical protein
MLHTLLSAPRGLAEAYSKFWGIYMKMYRSSLLRIEPGSSVCQPAALTIRRNPRPVYVYSNINNYKTNFLSTGFWMIWGLAILLSCCCLYQQHRLKKRQRRAMRGLRSSPSQGLVTLPVVATAVQGHNPGFLPSSAGSAFIYTLSFLCLVTFFYCMKR